MVGPIYVTPRSTSRTVQGRNNRGQIKWSAFKNDMEPRRLVSEMKRVGKCAARSRGGEFLLDNQAKEYVHTGPKYSGCVLRQEVNDEKGWVRLTIGGVSIGGKR